MHTSSLLEKEKKDEVAGETGSRVLRYSRRRLLEQLRGETKCVSLEQRRHPARMVSWATTLSGVHYLSSMCRKELCSCISIMAPASTDECARTSQCKCAGQPELQRQVLHFAFTLCTLEEA